MAFYNLSCTLNDQFLDLSKNKKRRGLTTIRLVSKVAA